MLKPESDEAMVAWLADTVEKIPDGDAFRLARHLPSADDRWVVAGWSATTWVEGAHGSETWDDALAVSRVFHAALASIAGDVPAADNHWRRADRIAWNEAPAADVPAAVAAVLERLRPLLDREWTGPPSQIIHTDIGNNVLFAPPLAPAVIDVSPYRRPAAFADAVTVADAMAWQGAPLTLAIRFSATVDEGDQLLARAVTFRLLTAVEAFARLPERIAAEVDAYRPVLSAIG